MVASVGLGVSSSHADAPADPGSVRTYIADLTRLQAASDWPGLEREARLALQAVQAKQGESAVETGVASAWLAEALEHEGRFAEAEPYERRAVANIEAAFGPDSEEVAGALNGLALALKGEGKADEAQAVIDRVQVIQSGADNATENAGSLLLQAQNLQDAGRYAEAEPLARRAVTIEKQSGTQPDLALALNNLAEILRLEGHYADAEATYRSALAIRIKVLPPDDPQIGLSLSNLAVTLENEGKYADAEAIARRELAFFEQKAPSPNDPMVATVLNNLGGFMQDQGRYADAEAFHRRALAIRNVTPGSDSAETGQSLNNLAVTLTDEGRFNEAEPLQRSALAIREKALGADHPDVAASLSDLATTLSNEGQLKEAEALDRRAIAIREKPGRARADLAESLNDLGVILDAEARHTEAEAAYRRAADAWRIALGPDHPYLAGALINLGEDLDLRGRQAEAEPLYKRAADILRTRLGADNPITADAEENLAWLQAERGDFAEAAAALRVACGARERGASVVTASLSAKNLSRDLANDCSGRLSEVLWRWAQAGGGQDVNSQPAALQSEAWIAAQRSITAAAGTALNQRAALAIAAREGVGDKAQAYEAALQELDAVNLRFAESAPEAQAALEEQRSALEAKITALEATLRTHAQAYWDYREPGAVSVEALQAKSGPDAQLLHENEALVFWMVPSGKANGLVFAVSKTGFAWAEIGLSGDDINAKVETLRLALNPPDAGRAGRAEKPEPMRRDYANDLYVALMGDSSIDSVIHGAGIDTLIIVPSGELTSLPPGLLVVEKPPDNSSDSNPTDLASTHWLIKDKAIAVLPAVSSLRTLRQVLAASRQAPDLKLLAFADPDFVGTGHIPMPPPGQVATNNSRGLDASRFERDGHGAEGLATLGPLYGTLAEGHTLVDILDPGNASALLVGPDASKTNLLQQDSDHRLARYRVLTFSTHGLLIGQFKGLTEPALALAAPPKSGADPRDDGLLKASDAAALTLHADWVVLSACNTAAAGDGNGAEGLSGLARAFFYAGASTLLVSHWRVDDDATEQLITDTFRFQKAGQPKAKALQAAMRKMLIEPGVQADPRYWAPFVVVGEPE